MHGSWGPEPEGVVSSSRVRTRTHDCYSNLRKSFLRQTTCHNRGYTKRQKYPENPGLAGNSRNHVHVTSLLCCFSLSLFLALFVEEGATSQAQAAPVPRCVSAQEATEDDQLLLSLAEAWRKPKYYRRVPGDLHTEVLSWKMLYLQWLLGLYTRIFGYLGPLGLFSMSMPYEEKNPPPQAQWRSWRPSWLRDTRWTIRASSGVLRGF